MAAERGLEIERSTLCRWIQEYAPELAKRIKLGIKQTSSSWKIDEIYLKIKGFWHYLPVPCGYIELLIRKAIH